MMYVVPSHAHTTMTSPPVHYIDQSDKKEGGFPSPAAYGNTHITHNGRKNTLARKGVGKRAWQNNQVPHSKGVAQVSDRSSETLFKGGKGE